MHHLSATEGEAVGDAFRVGLRRVGEAVGMVAEGVEIVARAQEEHLAGVLALVHRIAIVALPAVAGALDAAHRCQPPTDDDGGRVHRLDALVGHPEHLDVEAGVR